jgi:hypothetical protein
MSFRPLCGSTVAGHRDRCKGQLSPTEMELFTILRAYLLLSAEADDAAAAAASTFAPTIG